MHQKAELFIIHKQKQSWLNAREDYGEKKEYNLEI